MATASIVDSNKVSNYSHNHVHDDIALSILSKLPIKSLTRFTCAKKSWSLLFQNPTFMNMFRTNFFLPKHDEVDDATRLLLKEESRCYTPEEYPCILSGERFENRVSLDWPPPFQWDDNEFPLSLMILGSASVNGALCLYKGLKTVLSNPATAEFKIIPLSLPPEFKIISPSLKPYELQPYEDIIPFQSPPRGFGYDSVRDDFKVIRKVQYHSDFKGEWVYLPNKDDPFWETDLHELDMNDNFWEEKRLIINF